MIYLFKPEKPCPLGMVRVKRFYHKIILDFLERYHYYYKYAS